MTHQSCYYLTGCLFNQETVFLGPKDVWETYLEISSCEKKKWMSNKVGLCRTPYIAYVLVFQCNLCYTQSVSDQEILVNPLAVDWWMGLRVRRHALIYHFSRIRLITSRVMHPVFINSV